MKNNLNIIGVDLAKSGDFTAHLLLDVSVSPPIVKEVILEGDAFNVKK